MRADRLKRLLVEAYINRRRLGGVGTHHHSLVQSGHAVTLFQNTWEFRSLGTAIVTSHYISQTINTDLRRTSFNNSGDCSLSYITLKRHLFFNFLICIVGGGVQNGSTRHVGHLLAYCTCPEWLWGWRIWWNEWQGKLKYSEKTCPDATLTTTNPTWPDPWLNPGRRGGKPATNRFSYGAA
jgi:hypothetical protein